MQFSGSPEAWPAGARHILAGIPTYTSVLPDAAHAAAEKVADLII
jgi:hypothetical protein